MAKRAEINGHRLGIAGTGRAIASAARGLVGDCPERVDMLDRIEADESQPPRRVVAKKIHNEAVRCLMEGDRDDYRD